MATTLSGAPSLKAASGAPDTMLEPEVAIIPMTRLLQMQIGLPRLNVKQNYCISEACRRDSSSPY